MRNYEHITNNSRENENPFSFRLKFAKAVSSDVTVFACHRISSVSVTTSTNVHALRTLSVTQEGLTVHRGRLL